MLFFLFGLICMNFYVKNRKEVFCEVKNLCYV